MLQKLGEQLQEARQARGLSLEEVERTIRIRRKYLAALERGDHLALPTALQVRGFLQSYGTYLGLDAAVLVAQLDRALLAARRPSRWQVPGFAAGSGPSPLVVRASGRRMPFHSIAAKPSNLRRVQRIINFELLVMLSVVAALGWAFVWGGRRIAPTLLATAQPAVTQAAVDPSATPTLIQEVVQTPTAPPPLTTFNDVQLSLLFEQRSYVRVLVDDKLDFDGQAVSGERLEYSGVQRVEVSTANGAGVRVQFNQRDEGLMGAFGEIVTWVFLPNQKSTPTPGAPPVLIDGTPAPTGTAVP
jgi:transcriptional regulator with XRE-family HTH domain